MGTAMLRVYDDCTFGHDYKPTLLLVALSLASSLSVAQSQEGFYFRLEVGASSAPGLRH
ncbi:MAG: hypothetical protein OXG29_08100 [Gammaproteobacteria bacterium]|nr:hypothetical protein [Gammaproteobacteria bacterium]